MRKTLLAIPCLAAALLATCGAHAQTEGPVPTQALVQVEGKSAPPQQVNVSVEGRKVPTGSWQPLSPSQVQVAVLIDDGLRESIGRNLDDFRAFFNQLPQGLEVLLGFMQNGTVAVAQPFTADHERAAAAVRLPQGIPGISASPYFCLSDFVKHWPGAGGDVGTMPGSIDRGPSGSAGKARIVLMVTNGVDPYNGSTSVMNQQSPYVDQAITDAQRAGVAVYALYFSNAGMRGQSANFSGQDYLQRITGSTGGQNLYLGMWNAPNLLPYLQNFTRAIARTYVVGFDAPAQRGKDMVRLKVSAPGAKLHAPEMVQPGNRE